MFEKTAQSIIRILLLAFFVLVLLLVFRESQKVGYKIFSDRPYDSSGQAAEAIITVTENESLLEIGKDLERQGIVENAYITAAYFRTMEGYDRIHPGEYPLSAAMRPSEILGKMIEEETDQ